MIKVENIDVYGWEAAIRGARNPMNSWDKSDSRICRESQCHRCHLHNLAECRNYSFGDFVIGPNDLRLLRNLANAGPDHGKFLRMIAVSVDLTAPLYW